MVDSDYDAKIAELRSRDVKEILFCAKAGLKFKREKIRCRSASWCGGVLIEQSP